MTTCFYFAFTHQNKLFSHKTHFQVC